jgi:hypothetical protein
VKGVPSWLHDYAREVARWNASINLISRQDTGKRLALLVGQCLDAARQLTSAPAPLGFAPEGACAYFDLGSGAGLPGVVWHGHLVRQGCRATTWLVEPRDKRAWFLGRVARQAPQEIHVLQGLWGDVATPEPLVASHILVSLKALHLVDAAVLEGLGRCGLAAPAALTIARFYPHDQVWEPALAARLGIPAAGEVLPSPAGPATALAAGVLGPERPDPEAASLVVSRYRIDPH